MYHWKKIPMKFPGTCIVCDEKIPIDEMGLWAKGLGVKHIGCGNEPDSIKSEENVRNNLRLSILQTYSKRLSNSDIPCCRCCGESSNIEFLAIDHIAGRKQMDSEPELVKLGYSPKWKTSNSLLLWMAKNNFPKGFQILCHSCNFAKGHSKDNKCPHEKD
jgi:hypothetical protein